MIICQIFRLLPWFRWAFIEPLDEAGVYFKSDEQYVHVSECRAKQDMSEILFYKRNLRYTVSGMNFHFIWYL